MNEVWKKPPISLEAYQKMVGQEVGVSSWHLVNQSRINLFADVIEDHQFIHVDPERAKRETSFGTTVAHGFLTIRFDGRVAIVTGAGNGLGRAHALGLASRGAKIVVNDFGGARDGTGGSLTPAENVVEEIRKSGGVAMADGADVSNFEQVKAMVDRA